TGNIGPAIAFSKLLGFDGVLRWEIPEGFVFFRKAYGKRIIYVDTENIVNDKTLVYRKFWLFIHFPNVCYFWDGNTARCFCPEEIDKKFLMKVMDKNEYEQFENKARVISVNREYFPPKNFNIDFLLKVPCKTEIDETISDEKLSLCRSKYLQKPLILYDSRSALKLRDNCPIIDSVSDAIAILSRAPSWVALPGDYPSKTVLENYLEENKYYIACGGINGKLQ
ncbi:MAG: hypothetical protein QME68_07815, partial [Elusimicrobiota bacterium]|nr:hypothetical protein [Elusimicrobiota bacterium]